MITSFSPARQTPLKERSGICTAQSVCANFVLQSDYTTCGGGLPPYFECITKKTKTAGRAVFRIIKKNCSADLVFAPTPAFTRFSEDLLLRYAMITARSLQTAYVDPFARTWLGFSTTDLNNSNLFYIIFSHFARKILLQNHSLWPAPEHLPAQPQPPSEHARTGTP